MEVIKTEINKDKEFLKMLYSCGVVTQYGLELMNVSSYRINLYRENDIIELVYEKGNKGYKLTSKAKKIMSKKYGLKNSYTYRSIRHCSKLQEIYLNIDLQRYKWITETEALLIMNDRINLSYKYNQRTLNYLDISPVDAIIVDRETNTAYGIEIISPSYRERDLNKKEKFLNLLGIEAIFIEC